MANWAEVSGDKTWVQSLGWEDSLEKGNSTHSSILAWRIPWTEDPIRFQSKGSQRDGYDQATKHMYHLSIQFHRVIIDIEPCGIQGNDLTYIYYEMIARSDISHSSVVYAHS